MAAYSGWISYNEPMTTTTSTGDLWEAGSTYSTRPPYEDGEVRMKLPPTYLKEMASKAPIMILDGKLYMTTDKYDSESIFIEWEGEKYGLVESQSILEMERFYEHKNSEDIFDLKKKHVEAELKKSLSSNGSIQRGLNSAQALYFILEDVLPRMMPYDDDDLLGEGTRVNVLDEFKKEYKEAAILSPTDTKKILEKAKGSVSKLSKRTKKTKTSFEKYLKKISNFDEIDYLLDTRSGRYKGIITFGDEVYPIRKSKTNENSKVTQITDSGTVMEFDPLKIHIGNTKYVIENSIGSINKIENSYLKEIEKDIQDDAIRESNDHHGLFAEIEKEFGQIASVAKSFPENTPFELHGSGLVKHNGDFYVYTTVPEYGMYDVKDDTGYYHFDSCRMGVRVNHNEKISIGYPVVIDEYTSPFLPDSKEAYQEICLGDFDKDFNSKSPGQSIASILANAANIFTTGYTATCKPHKRLRSRVFTNQRVSRSDLIDSGVQVANER